MPITLGCPSCGKRFRARDESAGKRVKCPYCAAPVSVPTAEESASAGAPTESLPPPAHAPSKPAKSSPRLGDTGALPTKPARPAPPPVPPPPAAVASADDWGAADPPKPYVPPAPVPRPAPAYQPAEPSAPDDFPNPALGFPRATPGATRPPAPRPAPRAAPATATGGAKTPDQLAAPMWRKARAGLGWVLFGLFFLALPGFVGFAKAVCVRSGIELPRGPGSDWVSIDGFLNGKDVNSIKMTQEEMLDAAAYGLPVLLGGLCIGLGRLTCGAAPRSSGAKGMFVLSGLFTFTALALLIGYLVSVRLVLDPEYVYYAWYVFVLTGVLAEFLFLTGLAASGVALKRPKAARAVGFVGIVFVFIVAGLTIGWMVYARHYRPAALSDDLRMYEAAAGMLAWLLAVGVYWRAVRSVKGAASEFLEAFEE